MEAKGKSLWPALNSSREIGISFTDLCKSRKEIHKSLKEIGISFSDLCKWEPEIPISLEEIPRFFLPPP